MMLGKNLIAAAGNGIATGDVAEAIDFDGTNDYLSRSGLTGNADGKTFTFSAWVWLDDTDCYFYHVDSGAGATRFTVEVTSGNLRVLGAKTGATLLNATVASLPQKTFFNVLVSVDLANAANRSIYINDVAASVTWSTYTNDLINFSTAYQAVAAGVYTGGPYGFEKGRLSNVFLDYTYRDLSNSANRRLFVTADLKPADGQAALNPILYLPLNDPTAPGVNAGTGGNFTLTGTVARSGRGPNQYNAPYSDLNGSADFLSRTSLTGIADGKQLTVSFVFNADDLSAGDFVFSINQSSSFLLYITTKASPGNGGGLIGIYAKNTAAATGLQTSTQLTSVAANRNYHVVMSFDLTNTNKRHIAVNGQLQTLNVQSYVDVTLDLTGDLYNVASGWSTSTRLDGRLGALWFNTSYIDLSVADNLAKFVTGTGIDAKPVDLGASGELPTGTSPLIYLPMYGNNAGKNYGTGGDFTVNSGPYTGARGPNEFWGNLANFDGTTGYLAKIGGLTGISDSKVFTCSFVYDPDVSGTDQEIINIQGDTWVFGFRIYRNDATNKLYFAAQNSANATILDAVTSGTFTTGRYFIQASFDLNNSSNRSVYVDGTLQTMTYSTYTNDTADLTRNRAVIAARYDGSYGRFLDGQLSEFYFATDYIDFSQEANRLKFRDAFGNPVDLTQQIEDAAIPNPAIYMRFPPTSFGTNSGTGGNFTVNGTITDGGQL